MRDFKGWEVTTGPKVRFDCAVGSLRRIKMAVAGMALVTLFGTLGYIMLGFTPLEALYQTVTTLATVGFREVRELDTVGQIFTMVLIALGVGMVLYNLGVVFEALTEGHLRAHLERRRMDRRIAGMSGHVIVAGHGRVGRSAKDHLLATGHDVVVVDHEAERVEHLDLPYVVGDVTKDAVLRQAGIERARALVACLETDADTVYVVLSARALCPDLVIVARARTADSKAKLVLAGATRAVNPQMIGGRRLAAFALQPDVAEFMDVVMHDEELDFRIQQVKVRASSELAGKTLGELRLTERTGALLLAIRAGKRQPFTPAPPPESMVNVGTVLIAFGNIDHIEALKALAR